MNDPSNNDPRRYQQQYDDQQQFPYADRRREAYPQAQPAPPVPVFDIRMIGRVVLSAVVVVLTVKLLHACF